MDPAMYALRIVKPPASPAEAPAGHAAYGVDFYQPGLFCRGPFYGYSGVDVVTEAELYPRALEAAARLADAEKRHPGMVLEIVAFVERP